MNGYDKARKGLEEEHAAKTARLNSLAREFEIADAIEVGFPDLFQYTTAYVGSHDSSGRVCVSMWFVKDRIADVLRLAAELGARQTKEPHDADVDPGWREYTLGRLEILFHYEGESENIGKACRRVKTGVELVEKPIYEVVCE